MMAEMQDTQQRTITSSSFSSSSCGDDFFVFSSDGSSLATVLSSSGRTSEPDSLDSRLLSRAATEVLGSRSSGSSSLSLASSINDSVCMRAFRISDWRRGGAIASESEPSSASPEVGDDDTRFLVALRLEEAGVPVDKLRFFFVDTGGELSCIKWSRMSEPLIGDSEVYCTNESHINFNTNEHQPTQRTTKVQKARTIIRGPLPPRVFPNVSVPVDRDGVAPLLPPPPATNSCFGR